MTYEICPVPSCGGRAANRSTDMCDGHMKEWAKSPERKGFDFHDGTSEEYDATVKAFCERIYAEQTIDEDMIE